MAEVYRLLVLVMGQAQDPTIPAVCLNCIIILPLHDRRHKCEA